MSWKTHIEKGKGGGGASLLIFKMKNEIRFCNTEQIILFEATKFFFATKSLGLKIDTSLSIRKTSFSRKILHVPKLI